MQSYVPVIGVHPDMIFVTPVSVILVYNTTKQPDITQLQQMHRPNSCFINVDSNGMYTLHILWKKWRLGGLKRVMTLSHVISYRLSYRKIADPGIGNRDVTVSALWPVYFEFGVTLANTAHERTSLRVIWGLLRFAPT